MYMKTPFHHSNALPEELNHISDAAVNPPRLTLPLYVSRIKAGFPSPADDYVEQTLDLNEYCIRNAPATFFLRVSADGDSMVDLGIFPGDLLCVDRSLSPRSGDIVIAAINGDFTVKELLLDPYPLLRPHNQEKGYIDILIEEGDELEIFGVVSSVIRKLQRW